MHGCCLNHLTSCSWSLSGWQPLLLYIVIPAVRSLSIYFISPVDNKDIWVWYISFLSIINVIRLIYMVIRELQTYCRGDFRLPPQSGWELWSSRLLYSVNTRKSAVLSYCWRLYPRSFWSKSSYKHVSNFGWLQNYDHLKLGIKAQDY